MTPYDLGMADAATSLQREHRFKILDSRAQDSGDIEHWWLGFATGIRALNVWHPLVEPQWPRSYGVIRMTD